MMTEKSKSETRHTQEYLDAFTFLLKHGERDLPDHYRTLLFDLDDKRAGVEKRVRVPESIRLTVVRLMQDQSPLHRLADWRLYHEPRGDVENLEIPMSAEFLRDPRMDAPEWIAHKLAVYFSQTETEAFLHGDGVNKPRGILEGLPNRIVRWFLASGGFVNAFKEMPGALDTKYFKRSAWLMSRPAWQTLRQEKGSEAVTYGDMEKMPHQERLPLMGRPVETCSVMPDILADDVTPAVALADWQSAYRIESGPIYLCPHPMLVLGWGDSWNVPDITAHPEHPHQRMLYFETSVSGKPVNPDAIALLQVIK